MSWKFNKLIFFFKENIDCVYKDVWHDNGPDVKPQCYDLLRKWFLYISDISWCTNIQFEYLCWHTVCDFSRIKWHNSGQWKPKLSKVLFFPLSNVYIHRSYFGLFPYSERVTTAKVGLSDFETPDGLPDAKGFGFSLLFVRWTWKPPHCIIMTFEKACVAVCG